MDRYQIPEAAVAAVERVHGLTVTVHDASGLIARHLVLRRGEHRHKLCQVAKVRDASHACVAFDQRSLGPELLRHPDGLVQRCHAGLGEAVVPITTAGGSAGVLFAGPFAPGDGVVLARDAARRPPAGLPALDAADAACLLECLRQLAARLARWLDDAGAMPVAADRRTRILHLVERRFREEIGLDDVAHELGISRSRAAHVVQEECGSGFVRLLADARLDHAAGLLRHSGLAVAAIALGSGFNDISHFHRSFRRRYGATPLAWRAAGRA